ncbi:serine/threonine protein kinase [Pyrococcus horikoshii]|uniref:Protein kinase domain-containing protein n=1 Tax=Pyrococcus horikoshii (strain ATCC 700860 / DSM 12428 / JCM 9974 / NBRC 100139 / OT-3) TaxID=70601 RepID=O59032_PYRHO|nr:219aa long hypothetical protein [Pyrococcus horikoshii OT3]
MVTIEGVINKSIEVLNKELGKYRIKVKKFLAKGTTSFVFLGEFGGSDVIIKYQRPDSPRRNLEKEAKILEILKGSGITGELILYGKIDDREVLVREYLNGLHLMEVENIERHHLFRIAEKTYKLDTLGIDHGQIQGGKHILVGKDDIWLIDFEKASMNRKPRNLTSAMSMLFLGNNIVSRRISEKFNITESFREEMRKALKYYKRNGDPREVFELIATL